VVLGGGLGVHQPALVEALNAHLAGEGLSAAKPLAVEPVFGVAHLAGARLVAGAVAATKGSLGP
jgi:hypothetical protein